MHNKFFSSIIVLFLTVNGWSYHFDRTKDWNEKNNIIGAEFKLSEKYSAEVNYFTNSFGHESYLINITRYWPLEEFENSYFSLKMGIGDGYGIGIFPIALPTYVKRFEFFTAELVVLPIVVIFAIKVQI